MKSNGQKEKRNKKKQQRKLQPRKRNREVLSSLLHFFYQIFYQLDSKQGEGYFYDKNINQFQNHLFRKIPVDLVEL